MKFNAERIKKLRHRLVFKLIMTVGMTLLLSMSIWTYFNIKYQRQKAMAHMMADSDRLGTTIKLGTHYAMMLNSRDDINQIIRNIGRQKELVGIRVYNKNGEIKYSTDVSETGHRIDRDSKVCQVCHRSSPPLSALDLAARSRVFESPEKIRYLQVVTPIFNEPGCGANGCHVHPSGKTVLGAFDIVVSLEQTDRELFKFQRGVIALASFIFLVTSSIIFLIVLRFVNLPIKKLIAGTFRITNGNYASRVDIEQDDEMGQLARAINRMGKEIGEKETELNRQRDEYQFLFEQVPCLITVQDADYRLLGYNREFARNFNPRSGDYCYRAYKGRSEKCESCPVEKTFADGKSHFGEETASRKDGSITHWIVKTSPIRDKNGRVVAAMEMSLDISRSRKLERELAKSEKNYQEVFNNIPNPTFVVDDRTLDVLDCNQSVETVYGYSREEFTGRSFLDLFADAEKEDCAQRVKTNSVLNQVAHRNRSGETLYVDIWISPSEYAGRQVFLVTTSDITQRLETEQQLIQAGKMATLGEMATGVAHELNQPLSVIKTASSFCVRKANRHEPIDEKILFTMLSKIDGNVDRATRIITHMRQFAHKTDLKLVTVQINDVLDRSFEIFSQQLRLRGIEVVRETEKNLPAIIADPDRLEQVFINLLINARDAIDARWGSREQEKGARQIILKTGLRHEKVFAEVCDTGSGIPAHIVDKIFEPFFTTKEVGKGTGLGLSISYGIVKDCHGTIRVRSTPGEGTCFILTFPRKDSRHETA